MFSISHHLLLSYSRNHLSDTLSPLRRSLCIGELEDYFLNTASLVWTCNWAALGVPVELDGSLDVDLLSPSVLVLVTDASDCFLQVTLELATSLDCQVDQVILVSMAIDRHIDLDILSTCHSLRDYNLADYLSAAAVDAVALDDSDLIAN